MLEVALGGEEGAAEELLGIARARDGIFDDLHDPGGIGSEDEDAVGEVDGLVEIVGDEENRDVDVTPDVEEVSLHLSAGLGVERAEGLVHEEDAGLVCESAGDGDALLHAAGEFVRVGVFEFREADEVDPFAGFGLGVEPRFSADLEAEHDVAFDREPGEEGVTLEDHATVGAGAVDGVAVEEDLAIVREIETGDNPGERGFSAAGWADDGDEFPAANGDRNAVEGGVRAGAVTEDFGDVAGVEDDGAILDFREAGGNCWRVFPVVGKVQSILDFGGHAVASLSGSAAVRRLLRFSMRTRMRPGLVVFTQGKIWRPTQSRKRSKVNPMMPIMMMAAKTLS